MDAAWTQILSGTLSSTQEAQMRMLFNDSDCLEKRQFSPVHDIVLGLKQGDLEQEILTSSASINTIDSNGRTPLSWAASRGDTRLIQSLIRLGANPNIVSVCYMSPLHYAVRAASPRTIVSLLAAGAKVDQRTDWGQTPLHHAASYQNDTRYIEPLLDCGADVAAPDRDGNTPLGCAALNNNWKVAAYLLESGADVDSQTPDGWTALLMSVDCNSHATLRLLLRYAADPTIKLKTGYTIIHRAAMHGDIETITILKEARLKGIDIGAVNCNNNTARDLVLSRDPNQGELVTAFEKLLLSVQKTPLSGSGNDEDDEYDATDFFDAEEHLSGTEGRDGQ